MTTSLQFYEFDESYVQRLSSGDFRTEQHFVDYFSRLIHIKLRSKLRSHQAIEDVRQETFSRVFATLRRKGIENPASLGAFVNSVCNNVLLEHYRSSARQNSVDDVEETELTDPRADAFRHVVSAESQKKVREILEVLSEKDRRLIREVFLEEKDKDEVCREYGVDRDYLRVLLHRAKQSFKESYLRSLRPPKQDYLLKRKTGS